MADTENSSYHPGEPGHDAEAHAHSPHLAHHFNTLGQQFESAKLGIWVFLATEILMFGGLFCAYAVYRANFDEMFFFAAHKYLDKTLGGINTCVLICSSLTMAWAVRTCQLGDKRATLLLLGLTLLGGVGFMVIKSIEYAEKYHKGVMVGAWNLYSKDYTGDKTPGGYATAEAIGSGPVLTLDESSNTLASSFRLVLSEGGPEREAVMIPTPRQAPTGLVDEYASDHDAVYAAAAKEAAYEAKYPHFTELFPIEQERVASFFGIYFLMTGLHGIHVIIGMGVIAWLYWGVATDRFNKDYFTPVDLGGLYWHLVDLIWIYLFPLLYLID